MMIRLQLLRSLAGGECFPLRGKWQGKTLLQQIGGRVRESNKYALPVCEDSDVNIPGGAPEAPLTRQAMEEFWDSSTTAVACRPEERIVCCA